MINKKLLTIAVSSAILSQSAIGAALNLDGSPTGLTYAKESLITTGKVTASSVDYFLITDDAGVTSDISVTATVGADKGDNTPIDVRIDLTNAVFANALAVGDLVLTSEDSAGQTITISSGGTAGDNFVVFNAAPGATDQYLTASTITFTPGKTTDGTNSVLAISGTADAGITLRVFPNGEGGAQTNVAKTVTMADYIQPVAGLTATSQSNTATADIAQTFQQYVNSAPAVTALIAELGKYSVAVTGGALSADDGKAAVLADLIDASTSSVVITGDFSVGTWGIDADADNCAAPTAGTINTGKTTFTTTLTALNAEETLCNTVDGTALIPKGSYTATVSFAEIANAAFTIADATPNFGEIDYNGASAQVSYITTFSDYNQRFYIVNRSNADADYIFTFITESGATATDGTAATGTVPAGEVVSLKSSDVVTLTGKTRTAATLYVDGDKTKIDVTTQTVNTTNGGTDTVPLIWE